MAWPTNAANSHPGRNACGSTMDAAKAVAVITPTLGMVANAGRHPADAKRTGNAPACEIAGPSA